MKRTLLMLLPFAVYSNPLWSQTTNPVISPEYRRLVQAYEARQQPDSLKGANNLQQPVLQRARGYTPGNIKKVYGSDGQLVIRHVIPQELRLGVSYAASLQTRTANHTPSLQTAYAQGRNNTWQGPETGELFSYGPPLSALEYDGVAYPFNHQGKLVPAGTGKGQRPAAYNNSIFRRATSFSQSIRINADYLRASNKVLLGDLKLSTVDENTFIRRQDNDNRQLEAGLESRLRTVRLKAKYNYVDDHFTSSNRSGFLNRLYRAASLTPASFENAQGATIGTGQRSYSAAADNPLFLLDGNGNDYRRKQRNYTFTAQHDGRLLDVLLAQSLEQVNERSSEGYKPGTAGFPSGIILHRSQRDLNYFLKGNVVYRVSSDDDYHLEPALDYIFNYAKTNIDYNSTNRYGYQRASHEWFARIKGYYGDSYDEQLTLEAGNRFYTSGTAARSDHWLPYIRLGGHYGGAEEIDFRGNIGFSAFDAELPLNKSMARSALVKYAPGELAQYLPMLEITSYNNLSPVNNREWSGNLVVSARFGLSVSASVYRRQVNNDVFPVISNNEMQLLNLADHRQQGMELLLEYHKYARGVSRLGWAGKLMFERNRSKVTRVTDGYNYTPIAGFSTVHMTLVKGEPLGAIVGSAYHRDANNQVVISPDGFPQVDDAPRVIGSPIPDFTWKMAHNFDYRAFSLNIDLEWKKGGNVWNGTAATLDYYGRSATTAAQRNTTGYVFKGVLENGHVNDIPVSFYDPSQPLEQNRWVRYGAQGVAEDYIEDGSRLCINNITLTYKMKFRHWRTVPSVSVYAGNLLLWTAYSGADPNQLLLDMPGTTGLDFFNLPSAKTFGVNFSITL